MEGKIPSISGLATKSALTGVENKIPDVSNLVKTKISHIERKYITAADYNKFTKKIVANQIKGRTLVDKSDIARFINNADLDKKKSTRISNKSWIKSRTRQNTKIKSN